MEHRTESAENGNGGAGLNTLANTLRSAIRALHAAIGGDADLVHRLAGLQERLRGEQLQLSVLGQFKRGKSTFINALLGVALLPVAVIPLTAIPVFITWGRTPTVRVRFADGRSPEELLSEDPDALRNFLFRFVAEEANPENRLGVSRVDLYYPAPLLADGMSLIDTPGVGSTLRHNTQLALDTLPECDAALFVISSDPPITEAELDYLHDAATNAARIFYVLNKADNLDAAEQDTAIAFLRRILEANGLWTPTSKIFAVSARNGLEAKRRADQGALEASGMAAIETYLRAELAAEKSHLLEAAMRRHVIDKLAEANAELSLRLQALTLPIDELTSRARVFERRLHDLEERRRSMRDVLAGEQRHLREDIEHRIDSLRAEASMRLSHLLSQRDTATGVASGFASEIETIFEAARAAMVAEFSERSDTLLASYRERIEADVDTVRRTAAEIFDTPFSESAESAHFTIRHEPYWVTQKSDTALIPVPGLWLDRLFPESIRARRAHSRMLGQIDELVVRNAENLRWALVRDIDETFRGAATSLLSQLDEALGATRGVIEEALQRRGDASYVINAEVKRLKHANQVLSGLSRQIRAGP